MSGSSAKLMRWLCHHTLPDGTKCGAVSRTWRARCPKCQQFTLKKVTSEEMIHLLNPEPPVLTIVPDPVDQPELDDGTGPIPLSDIDDEPIRFLPTGIGKLDDVLGGGLSDTGIYLLCGDAGCGKSTLVIQICDKIGRRVLYASGEESVKQVGRRARRVDAASHRVLFLSETNIDRIIREAEKSKAEVLVIDSIQTLNDPSATGGIGSTTQVKACAEKLMAYAKGLRGFAKKGEGPIIILIGHVTNDDQIAGPKTLKHLIDVALWMDIVGETRRRLRCLGKNRFGASHVKAFFEMTPEGFVESSELMSDTGEQDEDTGEIIPGWNDDERRGKRGRGGFDN